jgi:polar amino acid transport system permease protein
VRCWRSRLARWRGALGLSRFWIWARIILPQAFVLILPPLMVEFSALLKGSALVSIIGYVELTRTAHYLMATTPRPFTLYLTVAAMYFIMCFALGLLTRQVQQQERHDRRCRGRSLSWSLAWVHLCSDSRDQSG